MKDLLAGGCFESRVKILGTTLSTYQTLRKNLEFKIGYAHGTHSPKS